MTGMRILVVLTGEYGRRHAANVRAHCPPDWEVAEWRAPTLLPLVVDYPEDYVPDSLPRADLILAVAEHKGVAELLPDVVRMTGARAVIAAVDRVTCLMGTATTTITKLPLVAEPEGVEHDSTRVHGRHVRPAHVRQGQAAVRGGEEVHR